MLRAKYLDWCSAQIADRFLSLSPDEIFELAERASQGAGLSAGPALSTSLADGDLSSYRAVVEQVTEVLARELELPSLIEWQKMYENDPAAIDEQLLGFWREKL